ncbi:hypothetical protein [Cytobacillus firmus]|uniref:Uncharacterized protein n=1 Tax=Cytobacillus firmus DS1 TaxID=1307436 RepID=W7L9B8_CYTFI|nr:hypothetical protein [Cytobacillus firmus]EWG08404.1 hypothetical protein PBF_24418 [Cytobacillus firmus DS1]
MKRKIFLSIALLFSIFSITNSTSAAVIASDSIKLDYPYYPSRTDNNVRTTGLYLKHGTNLGIYVNLKSCQTDFSWKVVDNNGKQVYSGSGDYNRVVGAPVGYYYLEIEGGASVPDGRGGYEDFPCSADAILSIQD